MGIYGKGTIEIPLEEFWRFVSSYMYDKSSNTFFGVPRINNGSQVLEIDYMFNSEVTQRMNAILRNLSVKNNGNN